METRFKITPMDISCLQDNNLLDKKRIQGNINELCKLCEKFVNKYGGFTEMYYKNPKLSITSPIGTVVRPGDYRSHVDRKVHLSSNKTLFEDGLLVMSVSTKLFPNLKLTLKSDDIKTYKLICKHTLWEVDRECGGELNSPYIIIESDSVGNRVVVYGSYSQGNKQGPEIYENSHFMEWINWSSNTCTRYATENPTASHNLEKKKIYINDDQFVELAGVVREGLFVTSGRLPIAGSIHDFDGIISEFIDDTLSGRMFAYTDNDSLFTTNKLNIRATLKNGKFHGNATMLKQGIETRCVYVNGTLKHKQNEKMVLELFTKKEDPEVSSIHYIANEDKTVKTKTINYRYGNAPTMPFSSNTASNKTIECVAMDYNKFYNLVSKIK